MEVLLFSRPQASHKPDELRNLLGSFTRHGFSVCVNRGFARTISELTGIDIPDDRQYASMEDGCPEARMLVCYGGDGTFLEGVNLLGSRPLPVMGVNSGRLGFLTNVPKEELDRVMAEIAAGKFSQEARTLLEVSGDFPQTPLYPYAFNEFSVQRAGASMIAVTAYIDGEMVATYWGDGVLLSTPAGSTAYSLSVGGPVVSPGCACFVLSPIAPHNLTMRPIVVPDSSQVVLKVSSRERSFFATLDNRTFTGQGESIFRVSKAKNCVFLVKLQNISFYDTLRNKMMWGIDRRDETPGRDPRKP